MSHLAYLSAGGAEMAAVADVLILHICTVEKKRPGADTMTVASV